MVVVFTFTHPATGEPLVPRDGRSLLSNASSGRFKTSSPSSADETRPSDSDRDVGDVPVGLPSPGEELGTFVAPSVTPRTVLERDDGHLFIDPRGDGTPRRLLVDRPNVSVRGEPVHRPWIRRAPEGWLISDALVDAAGPTPPVGPAQVFEWPVVSAAVPTPVVHAPLSPDHLWRVHAAEPPRRLRLELVPKRG